VGNGVHADGSDSHLFEEAACLLKNAAPAFDGIAALGTLSCLEYLSLVYCLHSCPYI
jgi:hypothetical protein